MASSKNGFFSRNCFVILVILFLNGTLCLLGLFRHKLVDSASICLGHIFIWFLIFLFVCLFFISAGKAVRVVSVVFVCLFLFRLGLSFSSSFYKKPHSSKNIYDFLLVLFASVGLLCFCFECLMNISIGVRLLL